MLVLDFTDANLVEFFCIFDEFCKYFEIELVAVVVVYVDVVVP